MAQIPTIDMTTLSPHQKMELADVLYDTAQQELDAMMTPLTPEHIREIDRRIAAADAGEYTSEPWEAPYQRLQQRS